MVEGGRDVMRQLEAFLALAFLITGLAPASSGKQSYACDREENKMSCGEGERIAIRGVEYNARKVRVRPCSFTDGDCKFRVNSDVSPVSVKCAGQRQCTIPDIRLDGSAQSDSCPGFGRALYRTIHYDCIPDTSIGRICSADQKVGTKLYLANYEYPEPIKGENSDCVCSVSTDAGNKVTIDVNELTITSCGQLINISDSTSSKRFDCSHHEGYHGYMEIFSGGPNIEVRLKSESSESSGRFLWELKASGNASVTLKCQQEGETPTAVHSQTLVPPTSDESKDDGIDAVAVGAAMTGAGILIALVVFIVCLFRKRRRNVQRKSSERSMDIREGVVDPFIVTADPREEDNNRNGTASFRPQAQRPSPQELVYATPGYSAPWESYSLPPPSLPPSVPPPSSIPPPSSVPPPSAPPPPVPPEGYTRKEPSHYTYITPDILHHVTSNGESKADQAKPKPAVRKSRDEVGLNGSGPESFKNRDSEIARNVDSSKNASDPDTLFVDNSLYEPSGL